MSTLSEISNFYMKVRTGYGVDLNPANPANPANPVTLGVTLRVSLSPASRINFLLGAAIAGANLVEKVVASAFFLIVNIFTAFQSSSLINFLLKNLQEIPTYLGAIPVGLIGGVFPQTVCSVIGMPVDGIICTRPI